MCRYCNTYKKKKCGVAKCAKQYEDEGCTDQPLPKKPVVKATKPAALCATKKRKRAPNQKPEESASESEAESEEASDSDDEPARKKELRDTGASALLFFVFLLACYGWCRMQRVSICMGGVTLTARWGSAAEGLRPPPKIFLDSNLTVVKRVNSTHGHWGVMGLWQMRGAYTA